MITAHHYQYHLTKCTEYHHHHLGHQHSYHQYQHLHHHCHPLTSIINSSIILLEDDGDHLTLQVAVFMVEMFLNR